MSAETYQFLDEDGYLRIVFVGSEEWLRMNEMKEAVDEVNRIAPGWPDAR